MTRTTRLERLLSSVFLLTVLAMPGSINAAFIPGHCSKDDYTIATINGISTDESHAKDNLAALVKKFGYTANGQVIDYQYLLNANHIGGIKDLGDTWEQKKNEDKIVLDYDLLEILNDASTKITTQKLLIVAHSQGNFYANNFYDLVAGKPSDVLAGSVGVYGVASPANHVAGKGRYILSDTDSVINGVAALFLHGSILTPNVHIEIKKGEDPTGHSFSEIYLGHAYKMINDDITFSLGRLATNSKVDESKPCINPPKLTLAHKIEKAVLAVADPVADPLVGALKNSGYSLYLASNTGQTIARSSIFAVTLIAKTTARAMVAAAGSARSLAHLLAGSNFSGNNSASVILASNPETKEPTVAEEQQPSTEPLPPENSSTTQTPTLAIVDQPTEESIHNVTPSIAPQTQTLATSSVATTLAVASLSGGDLGGVIPPAQKAEAQSSGADTFAGSASQEKATSTPPAATATTTIDIATSTTSSGWIGSGIVYSQTNDSARSTLTPNGYLIQTQIHRSADPTWDIKKITTRFAAKDGSALAQAQCKFADISFQPQGTTWNGTERNISAASTYKTWYGVTVTADDATKTCTFEADYGNLVTLNAGVEYDLIFSSSSGADGYLQIYGSAKDATHGMFGHFTYGNNNNPTADPVVADAYLILATSTDRVMPAGITPQSPKNTKVSTSTIDFSGTYRDLDASFSYMSIDLEATSTARGRLITKRYEISPASGMAIPFSLPLYFETDEPMGARWRVEAWDPHYWGTTGYSTPWNGATGYSDWQYFTIEPPATSTTPVATTTTPSLSAARAITTFTIPLASSTVTGIIDENTHAVRAAVPFGTDVHALTPAISVSALATSSPASLVVQDFTNPAVYTVTAQDGSTQQYTVTITVDPDTTLPPATGTDTTTPTISSYTFNGAASDITADFASTTPSVVLALTANKNVNWVSITIEDTNDPARYKRFFSGSGCVDGTSTCTKTWTGDLSHGSVGVGATYRIKVKMKDTAGNNYNDYLTPYRIIVK